MFKGPRLALQAVVAEHMPAWITATTEAFGRLIKTAGIKPVD